MNDILPIAEGSGLVANSQVEIIQPYNLLTEEFKRGFARLEALDLNLGYLENKLGDVLQPRQNREEVVFGRPEVLLASAVTQRLSTLVDRIEEAVLRVENLQRRVDV